MIQTIKLAIVQSSYKGNDRDMYEYLESQIVSLSKNGANLICLQELCMGPYFCQTINENHFKYAEPKEQGFYIEKFSSLAKKLGIYLIYPFFEKALKGLYYNSVATFSSDGELSHLYRKTHIPDDPCFYEKYYFSPGDTMNPVIRTPFGNIATLICWDQWFPENARLAALMGADIIIYPTAIGIIKGEEQMKETFSHAWKTMHVSHAISNGCFVVAVNRTGTEKDLHFWGQSLVCDPYGRFLNHPKETDTSEIFDINLELIEQFRTSWPFFRDRRTDLYQGLLKKNI